MRFEQMRDVLAHATRFHRQVSDFYRQAHDKSGRERVKMLLDYMSDRESELADALDTFVAEASPEVLDTWFQFTDDEHTLRPECPSLELPPDMSIDDVLQLAKRFHECLTRLYGELAEAAESEHVRDVFQNLLEASAREWKKLMRNVDLMMDI